MLPETILILGGTAEANALARRAALERPQARIVLSLAGRTATPVRPVAETRIGGFGGRAGLAGFLQAQGVTRLVDATHPFAVGISRNAAEAARMVGVPRIALVRPAWAALAEDRWIDADCLRSAANALPTRSRAFLALGRQHLSPFSRRPDVSFVVRTIDPPVEPLPLTAELVLGKASANWRAEAALFERLRVTHLVSRNSGGEAYAKIEAARRLGLPVVMIRRMEEPEPPLASTVEAVMRWLCA